MEMLQNDSLGAKSYEKEGQLKSSHSRKLNTIFYRFSHEGIIYKEFDKKSDKQRSALTGDPRP